MAKLVVTGAMLEGLAVDMRICMTLLLIAPFDNARKERKACYEDVSFNAHVWKAKLWRNRFKIHLNHAGAGQRFGLVQSISSVCMRQNYSQ